MARWIALVLGLVVVGLLVTGTPWSSSAQEAPPGFTPTTEDRVAMLEHRIGLLEEAVFHIRGTEDRGMPFGFTCAHGAITGELRTPDGSRSQWTVELAWTPDDGFDNPLLNRTEGQAIFHDCRATVP